MKKTALILVSLLIILSVSGKSIETNENQRYLDWDTVTQNSNILLRISNYGWFGRVDGSGAGLLWPNLVGEGNCEHLFRGALWIGGIINRRNVDGELLYWLEDANSNEDVITENDPLWTPDLEVVKDTLTSVGFDGDLDLKELLPAYNYLEYNCAPDYNIYNQFDRVMLSSGKLCNHDDDGDGLIDEDDLGRPFNYDDPWENWCFTIPYDDDGDGLVDEDNGYPGCENTVAYYYDYSPFGTSCYSDRDWGDSSGNSDHYPLGLAIEQQTWSYPILGLEDVIFLNWEIHNTSEIDTLEYLSYALYIDADIGPISWDDIYSDDVSTYNIDHEFAYSYDYDGDSGLSPGHIAAKIINCNYGFSCWTWDVGDGPDDWEPLEFDPSVTANEKYWLITDRNPNENHYISLRDFPDAQMETGGLDTRFLYSTYGAMPHTGDKDENGELDYLETDEQGDYYKRYNLAPGETKELTALLFMGLDETDLESTYQDAIEFYNSGFDLSLYEDQPSIPMLKSCGINDHHLYIDWLCVTTPSELWVKYKQIDEPAADWVYIELEPGTSEYTFSEITQADYYELQVAVEFGDVYLESRKEIYFFDPSLSEDENEIALMTEKLINYPNPFNPRTTIHWQQEKPGKASLAIYNLKGQKIKDLVEDHYESGRHFVSWDGKNKTGEDCPSGVYLIRLQTGDKVSSRRIMLLK